MVRLIRKVVMDMFSSELELVEMVERIVEKKFEDLQEKKQGQSPQQKFGSTKRKKKSIDAGGGGGGGKQATAALPSQTKSVSIYIENSKSRK